MHNIAALEIVMIDMFLVVLIMVMVVNVHEEDVKPENQGNRDDRYGLLQKMGFSPSFYFIPIVSSAPSLPSRPSPS